MSQGVVHGGIRHNTGPQFVQSIGQPNGPVIREIEGVVFLEEQNGGGAFPCMGGRTSDPHDDKQGMNGVVPHRGEVLEKLIGNPVWARLFVVACVPQEMLIRATVRNEGENVGL